MKNPKIEFLHRLTLTQALLEELTLVSALIPDEVQTDSVEEEASQDFFNPYIEEINQSIIELSALIKAWCKPKKDEDGLRLVK